MLDSHVSFVHVMLILLIFDLLSLTRPLITCTNDYSESGGGEINFVMCLLKVS